MKSSINQTLWAVAIFLFASSLVALNMIAPLASDDYVYSFVYDAKYYLDASFSQRLTCLRDIWDSQVAHYLSWNGRVVAHTLDQLFLLGGNDFAWSIANTCCLLLNVYFMLKISRNDDTCKLSSYFLTLCLYWIFLPHPGGTFFWMTGSCNYQWALLLILMFIYTWRTMAANKLYVWFMYPLALLAGNSQEALSAGIAAALLLYALAKHKSITIHQWCGLATLILGVTTNVLSSGVQIRLEYAGHEGGAINAIARLIMGVVALPSAMTNNWVPWLIPMSSTVLFLFQWRKKRYEWNQFFVLAAWLSLCAAVYANEFNERATFGAFAYSFIFLTPCLLRIYYQFSKNARIVVWVMILACSLWGMCQAAYTLQQRGLYELKIAKEASRGNHRLYKKEESFKECVLWNNKYNYKTYLAPRKETMQNRAFASYYQIPLFGFATSEYWHTIPSNIEEYGVSLQENAFVRIHPQWVLLRVGGFISEAKANTCFVPSEELDILRYYKRKSRGWVIRATDFLQIFHQKDFSYLLVPCVASPPEIPQEIKLVLFRGHEREHVKFPLGIEKGKLQSW